MKKETIVGYGVLLGFVVLVLFPIVGIVLVAFQPEGLGATVSLHGLTFDNFRRAWADEQLGAALASSAIIAASVTLLATALSVLAGFAFGLLRFRGSSVLFYAILIGIIFPVEGFIVPLYFQLQSFHLLDTYPGLILSETAFSVAFGSFWMRASFRSMPRSLIEAARVDGASTWSLLWRVVVPSARPAILTLMTLFFLWTWNDFLLPLVIVSGESFRTAPLALAFFVGQRTTDIPGLAAAAITISIPVVAVYLVLQRHFMRGMMAGAVKA